VEVNESGSAIRMDVNTPTCTRLAAEDEAVTNQGMLDLAHGRIAEQVHKTTG
jgi:hypothetical protein